MNTTRVRARGRRRAVRTAARALAVVGVLGYAAAPGSPGERLAAHQTGSVWDGVYTEEQARRGESLYEASCAECHGADLAGVEMAPGLLGSAFVWNWNGLTVGDLYERLRVSMPEGAPTSVSRGDKADILAYMLAVNGFPAGDTELASRTDRLRSVRFLAEGP